LKDLNEALVVELPAHLKQNGEVAKDIMLQLMLSAIGKRGFEEKYKKKLDKMKK
jgi:hypothetical protein